MSKASKTYIFCYDDHRSFSDEIRKRFSDAAQYAVFTFHNTDDFMNQLIAEKGHGLCKVAIIGVHESAEDILSANRLMEEILKVDNSAGLILLCSPDKLEQVRKGVSLNEDSVIPLNSNMTLRTHNIVKKLISEHNLSIYRRRRNLSLYVIIAFVIIACLIAVFSYFHFPEYF